MKVTTIAVKDLIRAPWILADVLMRDGQNAEALQVGTYITVYKGGCLTPQMAEGLKRKASRWLKGHKNVRVLMALWAEWFTVKHKVYREKGLEGLKEAGNE